MTPFVRAALLGLAIAVALATLTWIASLLRRDVSLVDRVWSLVIAAPVLGYAAVFPVAGDARALAMAFLLALWAVRLAAYITWRNWAHGEDRRYRAIRARDAEGARAAMREHLVRSGAFHAAEARPRVPSAWQ